MLDLAPGFPIALRASGMTAVEASKMEKTYFVYMLASARNGTLYVGVTNDLARRIYEHKAKQARGFTSRYNVHMLVWYESYTDVNDAIAREKQLKKWERRWKLELIETLNPASKDLYFNLNN